MFDTTLYQNRKNSDIDNNLILITGKVIDIHHFTNDREYKFEIKVKGKNYYPWCTSNSTYRSLNLGDCAPLEVSSKNPDKYARLQGKSIWESLR